MNYGRILLLGLFLGYLTFSVQGNDCPLDPNAEYQPDCTNKFNCTSTVTCRAGYSSSIHGESLKCQNEIWNYNESCKSCSFPHYGVNCTNTVGMCSSMCEYDAESGCQSDSIPLWAECDLQNAKISMTEEMSGTALIIAVVNVTSTVNIMQDDIKMVTVRKEGDSKTTDHEIETTSDGVVITFFVGTDNTKNSGYYTVTVQTAFKELVSGTYVTIYEPVTVQIYDADMKDIPETSVVPVGSETSWICEARGYEQPLVDWTFQGVPVNSFKIPEKVCQVKNQTTNNISRSILYIRPTKGVSKKDSGVYACKGENMGDGVSYNDIASFTLKVTDGMEPVYAEQQSIVIVCAVFGTLTAVLLIFIVIEYLRSKRCKKENESTAADFNGITIERVPTIASNNSAYEDTEPHPSLPTDRRPPYTGKSEYRAAPTTSSYKPKRYQDRKAETKKQHNPSIYESRIPTGDSKRDHNDNNSPYYDTPESGGRNSEPHIYEAAIPASRR